MNRTALLTFLPFFAFVCIAATSKPLESQVAKASRVEPSAYEGALASVPIREFLCSRCLVLFGETYCQSISKPIVIWSKYICI